MTICIPLKEPISWMILYRRQLRRSEEECPLIFIYVMLDVPVVLSIKVVEDFDLGIGVDVGNHVRGEDN